MGKRSELKLPESLDALVRLLPNYRQLIRQAMIETEREIV
jgi:hypothetical protein